MDIEIHVLLRKRQSRNINKYINLKNIIVNIQYNCIPIYIYRNVYMYIIYL